jgi:hypothetical protein
MQLHDVIISLRGDFFLNQISKSLTNKCISGHFSGLVQAQQVGMLSWFYGHVITFIYIEKSFKIPTGQPESTNEEGKASQ